MPSKQPLVSFIVSVYNLEKYIGACLDSILRQPFDDYEIVLVNNNSLDGSDAICREYASRHEQIRYWALTGEPIIGKAIHHGLKKTRGEYLHIVDGDDMLPPDSYGKIAKIMLSDKPGIIFGEFRTFTDESIWGFVDRKYDAARINGCDKQRALEYLAETQPFILANWRVIVKKRIRLKSSDFTVSPIRTGRSTNIYGDSLGVVRSFLLASSLHYIESPIYLYRLRPSSISRVMSAARQVVECIEFILELAWLLQFYAKTEQEYRFAASYMEGYQYLLCSALCTLNDNQAKECVALINIFLKQRRTKVLHEHLKKTILNARFLAFLNAEEVVTAFSQLRLDCSNNIQRIIDDLEKRQAPIFLAPTGNVGMYMQSTFTQRGVKIAGFFDNDEKKNGALLGGVHIRLPVAVTEIRGKATILIASMYKNVREELRQQFISLDVPESDLVTIDFECFERPYATSQHYSVDL